MSEEDERTPMDILKSNAEWARESKTMVVMTADEAFALLDQMRHIYNLYEMSRAQ